MVRVGINNVVTLFSSTTIESDATFIRGVLHTSGFVLILNPTYVSTCASCIFKSIKICIGSSVRPVSFFRDKTGDLISI